jgi:hypothetical protein
MTTRCVFALFAILASAPLAYGKGSPDLILVTGGALSRPIKITDATSLKAFDPWSGQFADWKAKPVAEAPCFRRSLEVLFYMKPTRISLQDRGDLTMIYATRYCSEGQTGYVYLPGLGEWHYRENVGTIIRVGQDGKWFPATAPWDALMSNAVGSTDRESTPDMIVITGGELAHPIEITDWRLLRHLDPWSGPFVNWDRPPEAPERCGWEYEVLFFKRGIERSTPYDRGDAKMIYGLRYCAGEGDGPGSVHLAGRNDKYGPENAMVWDGPHAGKWHVSTASWSAFIAGAVGGR